MCSVDVATEGRRYGRQLAGVVHEVTTERSEQSRAATRFLSYVQNSYDYTFFQTGMLLFIY